MGDILLALSIPALVSGSGVYAACDCWWRRRRPAPPSPYTHQAARLAEQDTLLAAEEIVDDAYAALGPLYDPPAAPSPAPPAGALSARPDATGDTAFAPLPSEPARADRGREAVPVPRPSAPARRPGRPARMAS